MLQKVDDTYGAVMTYTAAAANAGIGAWVGENWFLGLMYLSYIGLGFLINNNCL
jgi:hypothetical protein